MFEKHKIVFLRKINSVYYVEKIIALKELTETLKFRKKEYRIPTTPLYIGRTFFNEIRVYFIDYDNGASFHTEKNELLINPHELDLFLGQNIIRQIASGVLQNSKEKIFIFVMGILMGVLIGGLIAMYYYTNQITQILTENASNANPEIVIQSLKGALL